MKRRVVLLDITAMGGDSVCIAGIDVDTASTVRLNEPQPTASLVRNLKLRPFDSWIIDSAPARNAVAPHTEDHGWLPHSLRKLEALDASAVARVLTPVAFDGVAAAFGEPTQRAANRNHGWRPGGGVRSLATVRVRDVRAGIDRNGRMRLAFRDAADGYWEGVPFQDLRVRQHEQECGGCGSNYLAAVRSEFGINAGLIRVGLTRPFGAGAEAACWLQVTNIIVPRTHF